MQTSVKNDLGIVGSFYSILLMGMTIDPSLTYETSGFYGGLLSRVPDFLPSPFLHYQPLVKLMSKISTRGQIMNVFTSIINQKVNGVRKQVNR